MASNNEEYSSYSYIEEEEVEVSENGGFQPVVEFKELENVQSQLQVENDNNMQVGEDENKAKKTAKRMKKGTAKNSQISVLPRGIGASSAFSSRGNRILRKANISPGSELLDKSALFDGTYFSLVTEHYKEGPQKGILIRKFRGQCSLCSVPIYITGTGSSTFNFLRHLRRKHGEDVYQSYLSYRLEKNPRARTRNNAANKSAPATTTTPQIKETITLYVPVESVWKPFGNPRQKRPLKSVILEDDISNGILADVRDFIASSAWYRDRSVPYRRSFLLHGPSGCGKSSFVFALASELDYGLCVLNLSERELTDHKLNQLLNSTPENCIILLENIDDAFSRSSDRSQSNRLTLSGVLNCLDGVTAVEGRILFLTCIDIEGLDPSLLRPGRVDVKQYLGFCSHSQIAQLVEKFYDSPVANILKFVQEVMKYGKNVTPAQLQGFFLARKTDDVLRLLPDLQQIWDS